MQNRGAILTFAVILALVSLFQLSFTFFTRHVENKAKTYSTNEQVVNLAKRLAGGNSPKEAYLYDSISQAMNRYYLDSMSNVTVFNVLLKKYTYKDCKERELNLGLDLKGGMNVMMEVSEADILKSLSGNSTDATFNEAIRRAKEKERNTGRDFLNLFEESFTEVDPNARLAAIFAFEFKGKNINATSSNQDVMKVIREETNGSIDRTFDILRTRIDRFGVTQPNIQRLPASGRILIELPGIKDPERVRKLLQGTANLEFWETYQFNALAPVFNATNQRLKAVLAQEKSVRDSIAGTTPQTATGTTQKVSTAKVDTTATASLEKLISADSTKADSAKMDQNREKWAEENPLFSVLSPAYYQKDGKFYASEGSAVGYAPIKDTAQVNALLRKVQDILPMDLRLLWTAKPERYQKEDILTLYALKVTTREGIAPLGGDAIVNAFQDYDQNGQPEVSMSMNNEGARTWKRMTGENIGKQIAIVLDGYVRSAPNVKGEIPNGQSSISGGGMTVEEAQDMANILKAGKLPAPAHIIQEEVVGPSLGKEAIRAGLTSILFALLGVVLYMLIYYNIAGVVANIALLTNIFLLLGIMASLGATLTLPGLAGIVLTLGMAVDANVLINERIKEEIRAGKGLRLAISDGYKHAYSAIIDSNLTTLLTGVILYIFGSGPVQGFATTLVIGILTSLFTAIFISRIIFTNMLDRNKTIIFGNKFTLYALTNIHVNWINIRKKLYILSIVLSLIGITSLVFRGLNPGVDFVGGRTYVVRFDQDVRTDDIRAALTREFADATEVKTFGANSQVKVMTKYLIDDNSPSADSIVETKLYEGLKSFFVKKIDYETFTTDAENKYVGRLSSQKVGPAVASDIRRQAYLAVIFALVGIFIYISLRFKRWSYGLGGVICLLHDSLITISLYSLFYGIMPFNLDVDQSTIAAILTIIGYSINDSVIVFDRVREYNKLYPKRDLKDNINGAINSTLSRTINTSGTVIVVLLIIFILGGEIIRGFSFAMLLGVALGSYSSIAISTPIAYEFEKMKQKKLERKKKV
ncbi:MAG: protein translocase subunit SecDF [Bacteroidetes bacterium]|nr:protein translocase subunit SecDF [Bacteroidota bacterium]